MPEDPEYVKAFEEFITTIRLHRSDLEGMPESVSIIIDRASKAAMSAPESERNFWYAIIGKLEMIRNHHLEELEILKSMQHDMEQIYDTESSLGDSFTDEIKKRYQMGG